MNSLPSTSQNFVPEAREEKAAALDYAQRQVDEHYFDGVFADLSAPAEGGGAS